MSINLSEFESICRICIGTHETLPINSHRAVAGDITTALLLEYVLQLDYRSDDKLPQHMCRQCMGTLLHLYQFVRMARDSEQQLRKALETSTPDMPLTNKTNTINTFDLPAPKLSTLDMSPSVMNGTADIPASVASCEMNTETILIDTTTLGPPRLPIEDCRDYENHFEDAHEQLGSPPASESDYVLEEVSSLELAPYNGRDSSTLPGCLPPVFVEYALPSSSIFSDERIKVEPCENGHAPSICNGAMDEPHTSSGDLITLSNEVVSDSCVELSFLSDKVTTTSSLSASIPFNETVNEPCIETNASCLDLSVRSNKNSYFDLNSASNVVKSAFCLDFNTPSNEASSAPCDDSGASSNEIATSTASKTNMFSCPLCPVRRRRRDQIEHHIRKHTSMKPYLCSHCNRAFKKPCNLKSHMRVHTGERPYKCTICDRHYTQRSTLNRHHIVHERRKESTSIQ